MSPSYRLLHFAPDPFSGFRLPMAALVRLRSGGFRVAKARGLPVDCLPPARARMLDRMVARLDEIRSETLPMVFGPYVVLDDPVPVPAGVPDEFAWVDALLNAAKAPQGRRAPRGRRRSSLGYEFFRTYRVARHVRKSFEPKAELGGLFAGIPGLKTLSHWAGTPKQLLLMEPVVPSRSRFEGDLEDIASAFLGYRYALGRAEFEGEVRLVTYVTATDDRDKIATTREQLGEVADSVVDTSSPSERQDFLRSILAAAEAPELGLDA